MSRYAMLLCALGMLLAIPAAVRADAAADDAALRKWEDDWAKYAVAKDAGSIQTMLTEDYVVTDPGGQLETRAQFIASLKDGSLAFTDVKYDEMKVSVYGDAAVLTAKLIIKATLSGHDISGEYRFTDVFIRKDGGWKSVAGQVGPIMPAPTTAPAMNK